MTRTIACGWVLTAMLAAGGCGQFAGGGEAADAEASQPGPAQAVFNFLEAVRLGDDVKAGEMLTAVARQKTAELDMVVAPPGSDTASFEIGAAEMVAENRAQVDSVWSDVDHSGQPRSDRITWILTRESTGWRIAGMSTEVFPGQGPVVLNFEDPHDMIAKQRAAEQEAQRRTQQDQSQARQQDPFQSSR